MINTPHDDGNLMIALFINHLKQKIREEIQPEIDKVVDKSIDDAVAALRTSIVSYYDHSQFNAKMIDVFVTRKNR